MAAYDAYDEDYYHVNGQLGDRPALRYYVRLAARYLGPGPYLDYGCGTGHLVRRLSALGPAAGFDPSEFSAARARATAAGCAVHSNAEDLPAAAFTGITSIHVLEHLDDGVADDALRTWRRVLTADGRALVVTPDPAGRARYLTGDAWLGFSDATHINLKPHAEWRAFLQARGFTVVAEGSDGLWNVPYGRAPRLVDAAVHAGPALVQFLSGRLMLPPGTGESSIFVLGRA